MEVSVWCGERLPRVVCGVTEATTCEDIVVALAQAMGRAGRYSLVERWRDSERRVSPRDGVLEVLRGWGEHAAGVALVLRDSRHGGDISSRTSSTSSLRKALTFSGAHSGSLRKGDRPADPVTLPEAPLTRLPTDALARRLQGSTSSQSSSSSARGNTSLERTRRRTHNAAYRPIRDQPSPPSTRALGDKVSPSNTLKPSDKPSPLTIGDKHSPTTTIKLPKESNNNSHHKPNANLRVVGEEILITNSVAEATNKSQLVVDGDEKKRQELLKVVNLQLEKMKRQENEMKVIEQEVSVCEAVSERDRALAERSSTETAVLERRAAALDSELQDLELVSWVDKLALEGDRARRLRAEVSAVQGRIRDTQGLIEEHGNTVQKLTSDLEVESAAAAERRKQELASIRTQLSAPAPQSALEDVKRVEAQITERQHQIQHLEAELKDANLERLSRAGPAPESGLPGRRPGSARRLDSPQRLRETAVSVRHPQGLWV